jgi:hypothetical protein
MSKYEIKKVEKDEQVVWGSVHTAYMLDAHNDFFSKEELENLFKSFEKNKLIDLQHNYQPVKAEIIESYINKEANDLWAENDWVMALKIHDNMVWDLIKTGKINGYSVALKGKRKKQLAEVQYKAHNFSKSQESAGHFHYVFYELDKKTGKLINGRTNEVNGHYHTITSGTATQESDGHSHRYNLEF